MVETRPEKRFIGYARVSRCGQIPDSQLDLMSFATLDAAAGTSIARRSPARAGRRELNRMLVKLAPGDGVTVTRSTFDLIGIVKLIVDATSVSATVYRRRNSEFALWVHEVRSKRANGEINRPNARLFSRAGI